MERRGRPNRLPYWLRVSAVSGTFHDPASWISLKDLITVESGFELSAMPASQAGWTRKSGIISSSAMARVRPARDSSMKLRTAPKVPASDPTVSSRPSAKPAALPQYLESSTESRSRKSRFRRYTLEGGFPPASWNSFSTVHRIFCVCPIESSAIRKSGVSISVPAKASLHAERERVRHSGRSLVGTARQDRPGPAVWASSATELRAYTICSPSFRTKPRS